MLWYVFLDTVQDQQKLFLVHICSVTWIKHRGRNLSKAPRSCHSFNQIWWDIKIIILLYFGVFYFGENYDSFCLSYIYIVFSNLSTTIQDKFVETKCSFSNVLLYVAPVILNPPFPPIKVRLVVLPSCFKNIHSTSNRGKGKICFWKER